MYFIVCKKSAGKCLKKPKTNPKKTALVFIVYSKFPSSYSTLVCKILILPSLGI